jgi:hypothetical protein
MPAAIDVQVKKQVINQWLAGESRDRIAADNGIGAGTVSNIINEWKKGIKDSDYESIRELAVFSKREGLNLSELASRFRLYNYIIKLGLNEDQIESFIANCMNGAHSLPPENIIDLTNQLFDIAKSESIPPAEVPGLIKQKLEGKQRLEEQILEVDALLRSKNVDIETINEFNQLKEHLSKHNLSLEDPTRLLSILQTIKQIGYEPQKIVVRFSRIESLRQTEKGLKNNCKIFEERLSGYRQVLPLLQQILSMCIDMDKLLVFSVAVDEKAEIYNISIPAAAYRVIEDIENYNRVGGLKKGISRLATEIYAMNEICAPRDKAIASLLRLQNYGITDIEILNVYEYLNRARFESAATIWM